MAKAKQRQSSHHRQAKALGSPDSRISDMVQQWFLSEPLLFGAWTTHQVESNRRIQTVRCGGGKIEYNPDFIQSLDNPTLREVMKVEALRIVLKHPYERRKPNFGHALAASNLAIRECVRISLPLPTAANTFGSSEHDRKYFEYYYNLLCETKSLCNGMEATDSEQADCEGGSKAGGENSGKENDDANEENDGQCAGFDAPDTDAQEAEPGGSDCSAEANGEADGQGKCQAPGLGEGDSSGEGGDHSLENYCNADSELALQNTEHWDEDPYIGEQINELIEEIQSSNSWGSVPGRSQEQILATLRPRLDYRQILRRFRANILSSNRRLTRMRPSRRYGFLYMGSRRDFTTNLLFAVDVSGSISSYDIQNAFSIINRFFKYGIQSIDVIWFDTQIRTEKPLTMKRARRETKVQGRGGTNFQPLMHYLDEHRKYDGLIVFTDGIAPVPEPPKHNRQTRICWLFNLEQNWQQYHAGLEQKRMCSAFVRAG